MAIAKTKNAKRSLTHAINNRKGEAYLEYFIASAAIIGVMVGFGGDIMGQWQGAFDGQMGAIKGTASFP